MACASSLLSEEQFLCSICLEVFTDPITTPCGHNFCNTCITHYWDTSDVFQCPLCNKTFDKRPELSVNKAFSEVADQFRKTQKLTNNSNRSQEPAEKDEVSCDICTETKHKALKSCLVCLASYCENHLEPHHRVPRFKQHKLINPIKNLEDILCKKHDRPLELFCKTDHMCVCQVCTESDHKSHQIISLKEAYEGKKAELGKTETEVQQMIQVRQLKIQEVKHSVQLSKKDADRAKADSVKIFTALVSCVEQTQAKVIGVIEKKHKTTEKQTDGFIKELEQEITELKKRSSELKRLSHTEDHLHLLHNITSTNIPLPTKDWTNINVHPSAYVGTVRTAVAQLEKTLSQEMKKGLTEMNKTQQYAVDVTLDPNTANPILIQSDDGKQVNEGGIDCTLPRNKERLAKPSSVADSELVTTQMLSLTHSTENQKQRIGSLLKTTLRKGDEWYLIDIRWFSRWKKYVGFDSWDMYNAGDHSHHPGPIDNSGLFSDHETESLKEKLIAELDYVLVPTEAWNKLVSWYGRLEGQKAIVRKVIELGMFVKYCTVEVYLSKLNLCENDNMDKVVTRLFSKADTINTIQKEMRSFFGIPSEKETRLWTRYMSNTYEQLNRPDSTVGEAGLFQGQLLVIERKNKDGTWPMKEKEKQTKDSKRQ